MQQATLHDFVSAEGLARLKGSNGLHSRLPTAAYRDKAFQSFEYRNWLNKTWLYVGRGAAIPNPGDALPIPGHPYILVRNKAGKIGAFHNVCRHRGHRLLDGPCNGQRSLVCPYHHWTYDLDGGLIGTPNFGGPKVQDVEGFDRKVHGLIPVRCDMWHDWIFINVDGKAPPLDDWVAPMAARFPDVDFTKLDHYLTIDMGAIKANWKVCMENNMEPYHVPVVHRSSAAGQPLEQHYMVDEGEVMGCAIDVPGSEYSNQPGGNDMSDLDMSARFLLRTPNFFLTSYAPDKMIDTLILPDSQDPEKCWIQNAWYNTSGEPLSAEEVERWRELEERVGQEDVGIMEGVQAGMHSVAADDGGVLSPAWEACLIGFYREMTRALEV